MIFELRFKDDEHMNFFFKMINKLSYLDVYRVAFFYLMGLTLETMTHISDLYNFAKNCISFYMLDVMEDGCEWMTPGCLRICGLALNLYNGYYNEKRPDLYTPDSLFDSPLLPYFIEALNLRYSEYSQLILNNVYSHASSLKVIE